MKNNCTLVKPTHHKCVYEFKILGAEHELIWRVPMREFARFKKTFKMPLRYLQCRSKIS